MNKLILDYSKWRCGDYDINNQLGTGSVNLCNNEGFQCCLGQFLPQLNPAITQEEIMRLATPAQVTEQTGKTHSLLVSNNENKGLGYWHTPLATTAININDATDTTPSEKIASLKELFAKEGYEIEVINQP